jgi:hypothetical protein
MSLDPHLVVIVASTAAGLLMSLAGLQKNALERRARRRVCPSCGHVRSGRGCACG